VQHPLWLTGISRVLKNIRNPLIFDTLQIGNALVFSSRAAAVFVMHVIGKVNCKNDAIQNGVIVSLVTRRRAFCMAEASAQLERLRLC
jgi:hypothetical protein